MYFFERRSFRGEVLEKDFLRKDLREIFLIYCGKSKKITKKMKMFTVKDLNLPKYEWLKNNKNSKMFTVKDLKLKKHKKNENFIIF